MVVVVVVALCAKLAGRGEIGQIKRWQAGSGRRATPGNGLRRAGRLARG